MKSSVVPTAAPAAQLPVTSLVMIIVSSVPIVRHEIVLARLLFADACPVPGICAICYDTFDKG